MVAHLFKLIVISENLCMAVLCPRPLCFPRFITPDNTVSARISTRGAYLISWVEKGTLIGRVKGRGGALISRWALISFSKFRPQTDIVFISSKL